MNSYRDELAGPVAILDEMVESRSGATGAQLFVAHGDRIMCDLALGDAVDGLMTVDTVHNCYCLAKPMMGLTFAHLAAEGVVDLQASLREWDLPPWCMPRFEVTVLDLLDHRAGLDTMAAMEYRVAPLDEAEALFARHIAEAERRPAYSEILGGVILEEVIRAATAQEPAEVVHSRAVAPSGAVGVAMDPERARELSERKLVSVPVGGLPDREVPLLFEMLDQTFAYLRPAFGLLCSARDMGLFMEHVRRLIDSPDEDTTGQHLRSITRGRHDPFHDPKAQRTVKAAGGFMVDVAVNGFATSASPTSLGHNAGMAQAVAFTDPDHELTISLYLNGAEVGPSSVLVERTELLESIYDTMVAR